MNKRSPAKARERDLSHIPSILFLSSFTLVVLTGLSLGDALAMHVGFCSNTYIVILFNIYKEYHFTFLCNI
jgi:hypothetical protein